MLTAIGARWAVSAAVVLLLGGCSASGAGAPREPSPSSTPTAVEERPAAVAATLSFSASDVRALDAAGEPLSTAGFGEGPGAVVTLLTDTVGSSPVVSEETEQGCAGPHTSYQWDGAVVTAWTGTTAFVVGITASSLGGIRIETTGGFAVGDDIVAFAAAAPAENVGHPSDSDTFVAFDVASRTSSGDYESPVGSVGYATDGVLQSIVTPGEWSSFLC